MTPKTKKLPDVYIRWTESDATVIRALQDKLGVVKVVELVRQALRKLAENEGVKA